MYTVTVRALILKERSGEDSVYFILCSGTGLIRRLQH